MPLPHGLGRFNRLVTNRIMRPLAARMPPLAIVEHTGRSSGRAYSTPVVAFPIGGLRWVIPLTYGTKVDWLRNVVVAGGCVLRRRGGSIPLRAPMLLHPTVGHATVPRLVRVALRLIRVRSIILLHAA